MTLAAVDIDRLRSENRADLAALREVPNLVDLLRPDAMPNGDPRAVVWRLTAEAGEFGYPALVVGIRGSAGFLHWYGGRDHSQVPAGVEYVDGDIHYEHGGTPHGCNAGEEIPVAQIYAAAAQFVATGQRPTCIQWINQADVPNHAAPRKLEDDLVYYAIKAALEAG